MQKVRWHFTLYFLNFRRNIQPFVPDFWYGTKGRKWKNLKKERNEMEENLCINISTAYHFLWKIVKLYDRHFSIHYIYVILCCLQHTTYKWEHYEKKWKWSKSIKILKWQELYMPYIILTTHSLNFECSVHAHLGIKGQGRSEIIYSWLGKFNIQLVLKI